MVLIKTKKNAHVNSVVYLGDHESQVPEGDITGNIVLGWKHVHDDCKVDLHAFFYFFTFKYETRRDARKGMRRSRRQTRSRGPPR